MDKNTALKIFFTILMGIFLTAFPTNFAVPASAESSAISVYTDGIPVKFDVNPVILNGRTMVPFRALAEALNISVNWDNSTRTVKASNQLADIQLQIGNKIAYKNGEPLPLDSTAYTDKRKNADTSQVF